MQNDEKRIAVFIDFENVAMGVRESKYGNFNIGLVLKRLVEKGKIMVKRAYSDWHRYAEFKRAFHQAAIELIDVPQTRYSGKNSADIRMVVDALDLSYQKEHIDTFVLVSGDSDFSPLVSKLRENGRYVIGMGVKQSSSDLLINNCDEFIFYEDLVRPSTPVTVVDPELHHLSPKKAEAIRLVLETFQALQREGKEVIYGSMIKQTLIRKLPSFNETYYGYPMFSRLLEDAAANKLLRLAKDQKSGGYIVTPPSEMEAATGDAGAQPAAAEVSVEPAAAEPSVTAPAEAHDRFRRGRWDRSRPRRGSRYGDAGPSVAPAPSGALPTAPAATAPFPEVVEIVHEAASAVPEPVQPALAPAVAASISEPTEAVSAPPQPLVPETVLSEPPPPVAAVPTTPAPTDPHRGRGARRTPRFRRAAAASSRTHGPIAPAAVNTTAPKPAVVGEVPDPAASQDSGSHEAASDRDKPVHVNTRAASSKARTARHSRPAPAHRPSGNRKKPT
ncbi:MAG: NYN domain-containing protein [Acidimicrobiia bacterium]|nr:NYN domain-containing protein [Acidimicrobiia bacterium]